MLTRRTFIKSALASNVALLATPSHALQLALDNNQDKPLLVFADERALNAKEFISQVNDQKENLDLDIGQHFDVLTKFCKESPHGHIAGLTRDSDFFVLEQLAKDHGFYVNYSATHSYDGQTLTHEITAPKEPANLIATALKNAADQWPNWLAKNMHSLPQSHQAMITTKRQLTVPNTQQHNFLVSWSLSASQNS
ncbi:MAG: hypothetical protein KUG64_05890 [Cycloclasticus sp.]|nr:hypothetical protein [Cycloclasticus sp.]